MAKDILLEFDRWSAERKIYALKRAAESLTKSYKAIKERGYTIDPSLMLDAKAAKQSVSDQAERDLAGIPIWAKADMVAKSEEFISGLKLAPLPAWMKLDWFSFDDNGIKIAHDAEERVKQEASVYTSNKAQRQIYREAVDLIEHIKRFNTLVASKKRQGTVFGFYPLSPDSSIIKQDGKDWAINGRFISGMSEMQDLDQVLVEDEEEEDTYSGEDEQEQQDGGIPLDDFPFVEI